MSEITEITMPKLSDSMEEGTILSWLVSEGDIVNPGDELLEIETDKAAMTHTAEAGGRISGLAPAGESYPVGAVIARLGAPDGAPAESAPRAATSEAETEPRTNGAVEAPTPPAVASPEPAAVAQKAATTGAARNGSAEVDATPLARRIAGLHGISLADLSGTGPRGRITKVDVLKAVGIEPEPAWRPPAEAAAAARPAPRVLEPSGKGRVEELNRIQKVIAERMAEARATVPDFTVECEVDMGAAIELRARLKEAAGEDRPVPSFNDMIVKACAIALREHPRVNGRFLGNAIEIMDDVNIGIAVAADDGLIVPVVNDADIKSLSVIAAESRKLAGRVRSGEITPGELEGGTFTVSNLGMFGMSRITPIINFPQAAILGVGNMRETLAREGEKIVDRTLLNLTLVGDHRILNGADGALFLGTVKRLLESPLELAL